jgi:hypothetical protein
MMLQSSSGAPLFQCYQLVISFFIVKILFFSTMELVSALVSETIPHSSFNIISTITSKKNCQSHDGNNCCWTRSMARNSPLFMAGNPVRPCRGSCSRSPQGASQGLGDDGISCPFKKGRSPGASHSLLLTTSDLHLHSRSPRGTNHDSHGSGVSCPLESGKSPQNAGHSSQGDGATRPTDHTVMPTPPPIAHPAPSSLVMVPAPAVAVAGRPPQDVGLVYTVTSLTDSSKFTSPLETTRTHLYLMAAASPGSLRITAPKFTPVGANLASSYTRTGAASTTPTWKNGTPLTISRGGGLCHPQTGH